MKSAFLKMIRASVSASMMTTRIPEKFSYVDETYTKQY